MEVNVNEIASIVLDINAVPVDSFVEALGFFLDNPPELPGILTSLLGLANQLPGFAHTDGMDAATKEEAIRQLLNVFHSVSNIRQQVTEVFGTQGSRAGICYEISPVRSIGGTVIHVQLQLS